AVSPDASEMVVSVCLREWCGSGGLDAWSPNARTVLFRSMDGGRTWAPAHDGLPPHFHNNLTTHLVAASRTRSGVFAFHDDSDGIFITTDAAATWRQLPILVPDAWGLVVT
ncbi:MAG: hypothetical protein ACE5O2_06775, partial [Armatimonadota bacterium]